MARLPLNRNGEDDLDLRSDSSDKKSKTRADVDRQEAIEEFERLQQQWRAVATEDSPAGKSRRADFAAKLRNFDMTRIDGPVTYVDVTIPADHQGFSFWINDKEFPPGRHRVTAAEAQVLLHMIDANRRAGLRVFQERGKNINVGSITDSARAAAIGAED
ncbi:MAG: hypothetical protein ACXADF_16350 [Candidatus Thorarchaeota archaeon]|jgi:hypothetical protein